VSAAAAAAASDAAAAASAAASRSLQVSGVDIQCVRTRRFEEGDG